MAAPEAAGEIARMQMVSDTPRPTTAAETAPNADPTYSWHQCVCVCVCVCVCLKMAREDCWQNVAFQNYRRRFGDNQFEERKAHALHVCITKHLSS